MFIHIYAILLLLVLFNKLWYVSSSLFLITIPDNANYHLIIHGKLQNISEYTFFQIFWYILISLFNIVVYYAIYSYLFKWLNDLLTFFNVIIYSCILRVLNSFLIDW